MIETNGKFLNDTITSLKLDETDRAQTISNAQNIINKIITAYEHTIGTGHVGAQATGVPSGLTIDHMGPLGLVYGRIQSGKTRAMIVSTAMAFDNGFRIGVVMTSNINDLVSQTHLDFTKDLKGVSVFTKDDELEKQINDAQLDLENPEGRLLIIASKGRQSLENITDFLNRIGAKSYPMVLFDDEGDQASLDTNTYRRSSTGDLTLQPSVINNLISTIRKEMPACVYVSVTGTPQAVLLQSISSDNRPSFVVMLPHGNGYIGGDHFFDTLECEDNQHKLISIVPDEDKTGLLDQSQPIPEGLRNAMLFFLLSASAAVRNLGFPEKGKEKDKGYQFLCHPSLKNTEQEKAADRILSFLTQVKSVLMGHPDTDNVLNSLQTQYDELKQELGNDATPSLDDLKNTIKQELLRKKILVINTSNTKRRGIEYGPGFNFLIGGNTLGRGIAIPNLLVTYYVRSAKKSQIDTMHQHARMFGYRTATLPYTRLFITRTLYYRFRDIHYSDKGLRDFIEKHQNQAPEAFPVEFSSDLQATRRGVLDVNTTDTIWPGMQIYPNYMKLPQSQKVYNKVMAAVATSLSSSDDIREMEQKGKQGVIINADHAIEIIKHIRTNSKNSWQDKTIAAVIKKLSQRLGSDVLLKFRTADRTIGPDGFISSGTIGGAAQTEARRISTPTLWIMSVTGKPDSSVNANAKFVYPTIVVPTGLPKVFIFSKK